MTKIIITLIVGLAGSYLGFKLIRQHNQGQSKANNVGLSIAQGEWVNFLDADDFHFPKKIEKQIKLIQNSREQFAQSNKI